MKKQIMILCASLFAAIAVIGLVLAYIQPAYTPSNKTAEAVRPEPTEVETFSPEEKESIQAQFDENVATAADTAIKTVKNSKVFSLAVQGLSKGVAFAKKIYRGDYLNGYYDESSLPEGVSVHEFVLPENFELAEIVSVADGDTLRVNVLSSNAEGSSCYGVKNPVETLVRLCGVNTSESDAAGKAIGYVDDNYDTTLGNAASAYMKEVLEVGQIIWLQFDTTDQDQYGRLLRHVWIDEPTEADVNNEQSVVEKTLESLLLIDGIAETTNYSDNTKYHALYQELMDEAKENLTGLWALGKDF